MVAHNGNITNTAAVRRELEAQGNTFQTTTDSELIAAMAARGGQESVVANIQAAMPHLEGSYSLVFLTRDALIGVRDPLGNRPLCVGRVNGAWVLASESCALETVGAQFEREVDPGEIVVITAEGVQSIRGQQSRRPGALPVRVRLLSPRGQHHRGQAGVRGTLGDGPATRARASSRGRRGDWRAALRADGGPRLCRGQRSAVSRRPDPQPLYPPHVHPARATSTADDGRSEVQRNPGDCRRQARGRGGRQPRARKLAGEVHQAPPQAPVRARSICGFTARPCAIPVCSAWTWPPMAS